MTAADLDAVRTLAAAWLADDGPHCGCRVCSLARAVPRLADEVDRLTALARDLEEKLLEPRPDR